MNRYPGIEPVKGKKGTAYKVRYRHSAGGQTSRTFRTLPEARAFKNQIDIARRYGAVGVKRADQVTFAELATDWLTTRRHRPTTTRRRDGILNKHLLPALGTMRLDRIRLSTLQGLVNTWDAAGLKPNTIRQHVQILSSIFGHAVNSDVLIKSPVTGLAKPRVHPNTVRALTVDECSALVAATAEDYRPVIQTLLATGCRWAELEGMNVEDFSARDHTLRIAGSKTAAGVRTIKLDVAEAAVITKHLLSTGRSGVSDGPLFTSPDGHRLNYSNFRSRVFQPAVRQAGLQGITIHSLRRTHATVLVAAGNNAKVVQQRMGHKSLSTTLNYYVAPTNSEIERAASAMSKFLAQTPTLPEAPSEVG